MGCYSGYSLGSAWQHGRFLQTKQKNEVSQCWPLWLLYTIGMKHFNYFALLAILLLLGTIGFQYRKALDYGRTSYDSVYDTQVNAVPLTPKQIIVAIFSVVSSFALLIAVVRA